VENHPFLDFFICIKITIKSFFQQRLFLYDLGYFEKNIFERIDNKIIVKRFQNIETRK
jgi:hypothetical protein